MSLPESPSGGFEKMRSNSSVGLVVSGASVSMMGGVSMDSLVGVNLLGSGSEEVEAMTVSLD